MDPVPVETSYDLARIGLWVQAAEIAAQANVDEDPAWPAWTAARAGDWAGCRAALAGIEEPARTVGWLRLAADVVLGERPHSELTMAIAAEPSPFGTRLELAVALALGEERLILPAARATLTDVDAADPEAAVAVAVDAARFGQFEAALRAIAPVRRGPGEASAAEQVATRLTAEGNPVAARGVVLHGLLERGDAAWLPLAEQHAPLAWHDEQWVGATFIMVALITAAGLGFVWPGFPFVILGLLFCLLFVKVRPIAPLNAKDSRRYTELLVAVRKRRLEPAPPVDPSVCRCWEGHGLLGPEWSRYAEEHLTHIGEGPIAGSTLRRCPDTGKRWLALAEPPVLVAG